MQHLSPERIAALVDEPATDGERQHLDGCARCRADFIAMRRIVAAAGAERERPIAPLVPWQQLAGALRNEGVLKDAAPGASLTLSATPAVVRPIESAPSYFVPAPIPMQPMEVPRRRAAAWWSRPAGMAAAAALLVTVGVAGGRLSARGATVPAGDGVVVPSSIAAVQRATPTQVVPVAAQFRTPDEARATLQSAEEVYSGALLWLAAHDSALAPRLAGGSAAAALSYRQRLEVLDAAMATARRALYEAPDDPVMNRYYLATLGAREVTLRRLTTVLPASQQVLEY